MHVLDEFKWRGLVNQSSPWEALQTQFASPGQTVYCGFDPTADSLHVGSLLQIMILKLMQKYGHRPIILMGGGTTLIGDPSGKDTTRKIINSQKISSYLAVI